MALNLIVFYALAAIAVVSTLLVIAQSNPIYSVLLLIASFMALAGLYVLLDAPFAAVTQIIVYAGPIMVLFLFVVVVLNVPREIPAPGTSDVPETGGARAFGTLLAITMAIELVWALSSATRLGGAFPGGGRETAWTVREIGRTLFRNYTVAFGATSILILIAMIGAFALAGRLAEKPMPRIPNPKSPIPTGSEQWPS